MKLLHLYIIMGCSLSVNAQSNIEWFKAESAELEYSYNYIDCELEINSQENILFTKKNLFVYTHPKVRQRMKDQNLLEASAQISKIKENTFLILTIKINSANARNSYGDLDRGSQIKCMFRGKNNYLYLENLERDKGKIFKEDEYTLYQGIFPISKGKQRDLRKNDLYKLGVVWEEGYEEYEVFNIDLIRNQLNCLNQ